MTRCQVQLLKAFFRLSGSTLKAVLLILPNVVVTDKYNKHLNLLKKSSPKLFPKNV